MNKKSFLMSCNMEGYNKLRLITLDSNLEEVFNQDKKEIDFILFSERDNKFYFEATDKTNLIIDESQPLVVVPFFDVNIFFLYSGFIKNDNNKKSCFHLSFFPDKNSPISSGVNIEAKNISDAYFKFKELGYTSEPFCIHDKSQL